MILRITCAFLAAVAFSFVLATIAKAADPVPVSTGHDPLAEAKARYLRAYDCSWVLGNQPKWQARDAFITDAMKLVSDKPLVDAPGAKVPAGAMARQRASWAFENWHDYVFETQFSRRLPSAEECKKWASPLAR